MTIGRDHGDARWIQRGSLSSFWRIRWRPFIARHSCSLNIILSPGGFCIQEEILLGVRLGIVPGILPRSTCLIFSTLELALTSLGAVLSAPVCGWSPSVCNRQDFCAFNHSCPGKQLQPLSPHAHYPKGASQGLLWLWFTASAFEVCFYGNAHTAVFIFHSWKEGESKIFGG